LFTAGLILGAADGTLSSQQFVEKRSIFFFNQSVRTA